MKTAIEALGEKRHVCLLGARQYGALKDKWNATKGKPFPWTESTSMSDERMSFPFAALLDLPMDDPFLQAEIFAPVLPVLKVAGIEEAIDRVNSMATGKPLIAYCYSEDATAADTFTATTSSGNVAINSGPQRMLANFSVGFGGVGASGSGASFWGKEAMAEFTNKKHIIRPKQGQFAKSYFSGPPPPAA